MTTPISTPQKSFFVIEHEKRIQQEVAKQTRMMLLTSLPSLRRGLDDLPKKGKVMRVDISFSINRIFSFLNPKELKVVSVVSKKWHVTSKNPTIWRDAIINDVSISWYYKAKYLDKDHADLARSRYDMRDLRTRIEHIEHDHTTIRRIERDTCAILKLTAVMLSVCLLPKGGSIDAPI